MLRAGTTAPLIKFPRLIPADPLIALAHQALQGDMGQRPGGGQQTNVQHQQWIWKNEKKKYTECENGKTEKLHEVGVDKHPSL